MEPKNNYKEQSVNSQELHDKKIGMTLIAITFWSIAIYESIYPSANFYNQFYIMHFTGLIMIYVMAVITSIFAIFWVQINKKFKQIHTQRKKKHGILHTRK